MRQIPSRPWAEFADRDAAAVRGVLTDIDDTLTTAGAITPDALQAIAQLKAAGLAVIALTGRPMGWSMPFMRPPAAGGWPLDAIVAENGAVALLRDARGELTVEYAQDAATRARHAMRLRDVAARVLREVPGTTLARDSAGRVTDIAIDHAEFASLDAPQIAAVVALMRDAGMNATVSSIHINGWFGAHTKWSGAQWMLRRLFDRALVDEPAQWLYVGDSTNDQLMFEHLPWSVGVANLLDFADRLTVWPSHIAAQARGAGFAEVAQRLLAARHDARHNAASEPDKRR
jgi:HAD superfamily hydrolase (TIGR01484 family)